MEELWEGIRGWIGEQVQDLSLVKVYIGCAIAGGTVLLGQTGLSLLGIGDGDGDIDADADVEAMEGGEGMHLISVRTLSGFLTFFGLVGWTGTEAGWHPAAAAGAAFVAGFVVMLLVAWIMSFFHRLQSHGNLAPADAVGKSARVYLRVPGQRAGKGKITVFLQGRSCEFDAVTTGEELPTGSECRIQRMVSDGTFEVAPLE